MESGSQAASPRAAHGRSLLRHSGLGPLSVSTMGKGGKSWRRQRHLSRWAVRLPSPPGSSSSARREGVASSPAALPGLELLRPRLQGVGDGISTCAGLLPTTPLLRRGRPKGGSVLGREGSLSRGKNPALRPQGTDEASSFQAES